MLARLIATVAALLLACASPQADAYVRAERVSMSLADLAAAERSEPAAESAPPAKTASNPKTAPPVRARPAERASGKNAALSHCHVWENWSPLQNCASMPGVYQWDGTRLAGRTNATGSTLGDYQHAYGWPLTSREGADRSFIHADTHGTPQLVTTATGAIAGWTRTDVWGNEQAQSGTQSVIGYTGYLKDPLLDELYAQARQYRPGSGRFTSVDPWEGDVNRPLSLNQYLYGLGNPGSYFDPDGWAAAPPCALEGNCDTVDPAIRSIADDAAMMSPLRNPDTQPKPTPSDQYLPEVGPISDGPIPGGIAGNAIRSKVYQQEELDRVRRFNDRVGNGVSLITPFFHERNELGIEQKYNPYTGNRLTTQDWNTAFGDVSALVSAGVEYFGLKSIAPATRNVVEGESGELAVRVSSEGRTSTSRLLDDCCARCFGAGTLVMTADGLRPIEQVKVGERVMARDEVSGKTDLKTVQHVIVRNDREVNDLTFTDGTGNEELIAVTADHRFHTADRGWVVSAELEFGETIDSLDGRTLTLKARSEHSRHAATYNLSVEENPNYFVGRSGLWVHNCTPCGPSSSSEGGSQITYKVDEKTGLTIEAEGLIAGPHPGRKKGSLPNPVGGLVPGDHRGHLIPEGGVSNPSLVNVSPNLISESPKSNLSLKKSLDLEVSRLAAENPGSAVRVRAVPQREADATRPHAVTYYISVNGVEVKAMSILNPPAQK